MRLAEKDILNGTTLDYLLKLDFGNKSNGMSAFMTDFYAEIRHRPRKRRPSLQIKLPAGDKSTLPAARLIKIVS